MNLKFTPTANGTNNPGIEDHSNDPPTLFCYSTKEKSELILKAMKLLAAKPKREVKVFRIPTIEEVQEYCELIESTIDSEKFWLHYNSNGWMAGRVKMKDWRSALKLWQRRDIKDEKQKPQKAVIGRATVQTVTNNANNWE